MDHNIPTIIKEKGTPHRNFEVLNWTFQYGRQLLYLRLSRWKSGSKLSLNLSAKVTTLLKLQPLMQYAFKSSDEGAAGNYKENVLMEIWGIWLDLTSR